MFGITDIVAYTLAVTVLILLPGPNSMFCLAVAGQYGAKTARRAIAGTFLGNGTLIAASALGAGALLKAYPFLFDGLKLVGGTYLAWLGIKLLYSARQRWCNGTPQAVPAGALPAGGKPKVFKKALMVALLNPKGLLFFPSMMVQFVDISYPHPLTSFLVLGLIFQTISLIFLNLTAPAARRLTQMVARHRRAGAAGKGGVGALFIAFAAKLWCAAV
ncbi:leucine efflux protein LeuE [Uruburuella testudinis]|uniref:Leucine efflux protein LeuE n=1 Tax=Uruburuella testudinis TaxID=1282863 RepID=A0ABY4DPK7_9NEIS|nr:leucine efflux protein LeuE [Uruburuella testudinis]UOO80989.1 leucine efflux protein LeuE [Uruburuella testudinis]